MCLQFVYINPIPSEGEYKVVIANNRDETLSRLTAPANFLPHKDHIYCPLDLDPARPPGGTWIGVNKFGKIGSLLNSLTVNLDTSAAGRGHIVSNYLSCHLSAPEYIMELRKSNTKYNPFHFIAIDIPLSKEAPAEMHYFTNIRKKGYEKLNNGYHGFCNTDDKTKPWEKCSYGLRQFTTIVSEHSQVEQQAALVEHLLMLMSDNTPRLDERILRQAGCWSSSDEYYRHYSAINVQAYKDDYGTRTQTVVLVDNDNSLQYHERNLTSPPIVGSGREAVAQWQTNSSKITLQSP